MEWKWNGTRARGRETQFRGSGASGSSAESPERGTTAEAGNRSQSALESGMLGYPLPVLRADEDEEDGAKWLTAYWAPRQSPPVGSLADQVVASDLACGRGGRHGAPTHCRLPRLSATDIIALAL
ncbi:hypothetical protein CRG98_018668 [Punica granatum]|uniref:Uncharacterized protein n=1 Tax=Punica granatum TaxID=22663 RepID=A0A2I0JX98_PUNGR|nr:hypothetical protein CRG98_018668 [Punica granatum]